MPPKAKAAPADMLAQAVKARDAAKATLDKENGKVNKATEKFTAAETKKNEAVADRDAAQEALNEAQRLVDALSVLVDGAPDPQTVTPDGVESGEQVMTDLPTGETAPLA